MVRPLLLPILGLAACGGDGASFALTLHPYAPVGQDPFGASPTVVLSVEDAAGVAFTSIGALGGDVRSGADDRFGPLDGAYVGISAQDGGDDFDAARLLAFGDVGPFTLLDEEEEADVLVAAVAGVGGLDTLDADHAALRGAVAMLPDGSTWLFGGARTVTASSGAGHAVLQSITTLDAPSWAVDPVGELPDFDANGAAETRVGLTATAVTTADGPRVFVAGGRPQTTSLVGSSKDAALYDPASRTWEWTTRSMVGTRSEHRAIALADGQVLLVGGWAGDGVYSAATWELFDPAARAFRAATSPLPNGALGFDVVPLDAGGALLCGGGAYEGTGTASTTPQDDCVLLSASASATPTSPLPVALQGLAMAALADGRVLACGGLTDVAEEGAFAVATDRAFLWDPGSESWEEVGPLDTPRAGHRAIPLPDGDVVIVGGVQQGGLLSPVRSGPVRCNERFDAETATFSAVEPCGAAGSGDLPAVAWDARHGAIVISGAGADGAGGADVGVVGFPPTF